MLHWAENSWMEFSASTTLGKRGTSGSIHRRFWKFKIEGVPRRMDGKMRPVEIYRDYESVNGLMVPYVLETSVQGAKESHNMTIKYVVVKPKLEHSLFTVPKIK